MTYSLKDGKKVSIRTPNAGDAQVMIDVIAQADVQTRFLAREPGEFDIMPEKEWEIIEGSPQDEHSA